MAPSNKKTHRKNARSGNRFQTVEKMLAQWHAEKCALSTMKKGTSFLKD
jgi:hypothetical protein